LKIAYVDFIDKFFLKKTKKCLETIGILMSKIISQSLIKWDIFTGNKRTEHFRFGKVILMVLTFCIDKFLHSVGEYHPGVIYGLKL
jgi:predicted membrane protein